MDVQLCQCAGCVWSVCVCLSVRLCVCVCVCVCIYACVCVCLCVCLCVRARVCVYPTSCILHWQSLEETRVWKLLLEFSI